MNMANLGPKINEIATKFINRIVEVSNKRKPLVAIRCLTYNHEPYLRDALEGFLMQKTDFPYVVIVHEDASTDGTAEVIRQYARLYPEIILPIFEKDNQYSKPDGSLSRIMNKACEETGAKYIAFCEGDDYWTDPYKLQKQVDFLEANPDYGMVFGKAKYFIQRVQKYGLTFGKNVTNISSLLLSNTIPTPTVLIKSHLLNQYDKEYSENQWLMGDYPLWLFVASKYNIGFIDEVLAVYRVLDNSACHSQDIEKTLRFINSFHEIRTYFNKKYNILSQDELDNKQIRLLFNIALINNSRDYTEIYYHKITQKDILVQIKYYIYKLGLSSIFRIISRIKGYR